MRLAELRTDELRSDGGGRGDPLLLGVAGDAAAPIGIDLVGGRVRFLIAGPPRSGRSTALHTLLNEALRIGVAVVVLAGARSPLREVADHHDVRVIENDDDPGRVPVRPTLLLVDDVEEVEGSTASEVVLHWARSADAPLGVVVAGRTDELVATWTGLAAEVRRLRCGLLLRPRTLDGELFGVRLSREPVSGPPGRGVLIGDPRWGPAFGDHEAVPIQVARP